MRGETDVGCSAREMKGRTARSDYWRIIIGLVADRSWTAATFNLRGPAIRSIQVANDRDWVNAPSGWGSCVVVPGAF